MAENLFMFTVTCGGRQVTLPAPNPARAIYDACAKWGEEFKHIAGYCIAVKGGKARKPMCRRCGKEYGRPGQEPGPCPDCEKIEALIRRDMARMKSPDRRARYGH